MSIKNDIVWRVGLVYVVILVFAVVVASKLIVLQFIKDDEWKKIAREERIKYVEIPSHRGDIYAEDMRLIASSVPYYQVRMDFKADALTDKVFYGNLDSLAICMSQLFRDKNTQMYIREFRRAREKGERYYLVKDNVDYLQLKKLKQFPIFRRGRYKGGVIYVQKTRRVRPHGELARRTIGFITQSETDNDVGLEGAFNQYLQGVNGYKKMQKLSGGAQMPIDGEGEVDPKDGSNIITTIDIDLQDVAHRALLEQLKKHDAQYGTVVLMHVKTGDIKAIVNLSKYGNKYSDDYNYAVGSSTEPGSTFKIPAIMTALEDGLINLNDTIDTGNGRYEVFKDFYIKDDSYGRGGYGNLSVKQVIEKSSNVGMAKIITKSYKKNPTHFVDKLYNWSLNEPLGVEIPGEGIPQINYPGDKLWSGVSLAQMSFGYEVELTPLQILTFYNAIANNGIMVKPRFVSEVRSHGKTVQTFSPVIIEESICSKNTLKKVRTMLEGVVENGTATNLKASHFKIAGKTGTTQIYNKVGGYKGKRSYQASFAGYFPVSNPTYSCIVVISAPSRNVYYGNQVAGPVFLEIANKVYSNRLELQKSLNSKQVKIADIPYSKNGYLPETKKVLSDLGIKVAIQRGTEDWIYTQKEENRVLLGNKSMVDNLMPDLISMGLKDAIYILENMGLEVEVHGRGSIKKQSIPVGSRITKGQKVILELSFTEG